MNNTDVLTSLPESLALFNDTYNAMLDMNESNTVIFDMAVRLRNNIYNETHAYYKDILMYFKADTWEDRFKAFQLWDSDLGTQLEDIKDKTRNKFLHASSHIYKEIQANHPDIFNKKFVTSEGTNFQDLSKDVTSLREKCRGQYLDLQQSLRDDPKLQEAFNKFKK